MFTSQQIFQRVWSRRVVNKTTARQLLVLIDQIHEWGVTTHRDFVIRHLKAGYRYCPQSYAHDRNDLLRNQKEKHGWKKRLLQPADWVESFAKKFGANNREIIMHRKAGSLLFRAADRLVQNEDWEWECHIARCGEGAFPGFPTLSLDDYIQHVEDFHDHITAGERQRWRVVHETRLRSKSKREKAIRC